MFFGLNAWLADLWRQTFPPLESQSFPPEALLRQRVLWPRQQQAEGKKARSIAQKMEKRNRMR